MRALVVIALCAAASMGATRSAIGQDAILNDPKRICAQRMAQFDGQYKGAEARSPDSPLLRRARQIRIAAEASCNTGRNSAGQKMLEDAMALLGRI